MRFRTKELKSCDVHVSPELQDQILHGFTVLVIVNLLMPPLPPEGQLFRGRRKQNSTVVSKHKRCSWMQEAGSKVDTAEPAAHTDETQ